jgi:hypothetical protein
MNYNLSCKYVDIPYGIKNEIGIHNVPITLHTMQRKSIKTMKLNLNVSINYMLDYLKKQNPKHFYCLFSKKKRRNVQNNLTNKDFYMHFRELIQDDDNNTIGDIINDGSVYDELDREITYDEIKTAIRKLKLNKSCSEDCVLNEVFINCEEILMPLLHEYFNKILESGLYPHVWSRSCIVPVYKRR